MHKSTLILQTQLVTYYWQQGYTGIDATLSADPYKCLKARWLGVAKMDFCQSWHKQLIIIWFFYTGENLGGGVSLGFSSGLEEGFRLYFYFFIGVYLEQAFGRLQSTLISFEIRGSSICTH